MKHIVVIVLLCLLGTSLYGQQAPVVLPTQNEAVSKLVRVYARLNLELSPGQIEGAKLSAKQEEIKAITSGHPERVASEDLTGCQEEIDRLAKIAADTAAQAKAKAEADAKAHAVSVARAKASDDAEAERERKQHDTAMKLNHCRDLVTIGTSEICVYIVMGYPDSENDDLRSGKQLVYRLDHVTKYIHIGLQGTVENVQTDHF